MNLVNHPPAEMKGSRTGTYSYALLMLAVAYIVNDFSNVSLAPMVSTMTAAMELTPAETSWVLNISTITAILSVATLARLADIFGHKKILVPLQAVGVIGALVAASSGSFEQLFIGRALTGLAIVAPMIWAMVKVKADADGMQKAAIVAGVVASGFTPVALVLGGSLLQLGASWTSVLWVIAAVNAVLLVLAFFIPETPATSRSNVAPDWFGGLLLAATMLCLVTALNEGPSWGWGSPSIVGLFVAAAVAFAAFVFQQRVVRFPMIDFRGMDKRQLIAGYAIMCGVAVIAPAMFILIPAIGQTPEVTGYGFGQNVLISSLPLLAIVPGTLLAGATSRILLPRFGPRVPVVLGGAIVVVSMLLGAFAHSSPSMLWVCTGVYAYGGVIAYNVAAALVAAAGRQDNMSLTFGMMTAIQAPFSALTVAVMITILAASSTLFPGMPVPLPTDTAYVTNFLIMAAAGLVLMVVSGLTLVPKRLTHHSIAQGPPSTSVVAPLGEPDTAFAITVADADPDLSSSGADTVR